MDFHHSDDDFFMYDMSDEEIEEEDEGKRTEEIVPENEHRVVSIFQDGTGSSKEGNTCTTCTGKDTEYINNTNRPTLNNENALSSARGFYSVAEDRREDSGLENCPRMKPRMQVEERDFGPVEDVSMLGTASYNIQTQQQIHSHQSHQMDASAIDLGQTSNESSSKTSLGQDLVIQFPHQNNKKYIEYSHSTQLPVQQAEQNNPLKLNPQEDIFPGKNTTSYYKAASLSVFNVTGNTGVKVIHQHDDDQSKLRLEKDLNTDLLVKTDKVRQCEEQLKTWGMVTITGGAGEGKTMAGLYLLKMMSDTDSRQPLILTDPSQWDLIPSFQHKKNRFTVFIDDAFGKTNLVEDLRIKWEQKFQMILPMIEAGCVCLVVAMRINIYHLCEGNLNNFELFKHPPVEFSTTDITEPEKLNLLENHIRLLGKNVAINKHEKTKIIQSSCLIAFPLCCYLYTSNKQVHGVHDFFNRPLTFLQQSVRDFSERNPINYLVLLLVLFYDNKLPAKALNVFKQSSHDKDIIDKLKQLCRMTNPSNTTLRTILDAAHCLCKTYVIWDENEEQFSFLHNSINDAVFVEFCKENIEIGIEMCHVSTLLEYVRTEKGSEVEVIALVHRNMFGVLAGRLTKELLSDNQQLIVTHPAFRDLEFRKFLFQFWSMETKTRIVTYKGERQHVRSNQCLSEETIAYLLDRCLNINQSTGDHSFTSYTFEGFHFDSILASFVMNRADRLALQLLYFAKDNVDQQCVSELSDSMLISSFYMNNRCLVDELIASAAQINLNCFMAACLSPHCDDTITELAAGVLNDVVDTELLKNLLRLCLENCRLSIVHNLIKLLSRKAQLSEMFLQVLILLHNATPAWLQTLGNYTNFVQKTLKLLYDLGADCSSDECLLVAAGCSDVSVLMCVLKFGCNINCRNANKQTPLHLAALYGSLQNVELLLENKCDVLETDLDRCSPLHFAVQSLTEASEKVCILLAKSDVHFQNVHGETAITLAIQKGDLGSTEHLCIEMKRQNSDLQASLNTALRVLMRIVHQYSQEATDLLHSRSLRHRFAIVRILKQFVLNTDTNETPHHIHTVCSSETNTSEAFIEEIHSTDILLDLLNHSIECGIFSIFKVLLDKLKTTGDIPGHLLHTLTETLCLANMEVESLDGNEDEIKCQMLGYFLSTYSLDINITNNQGLAALHIVAIHGHLELVKYLLDKGANVNVKSNIVQLPKGMLMSLGP